MPTDVLEWTVAGGVVRCRFPEGWRYLLILDGHGNWGLPKGHLEEGEGPLEAAVREIGEETSLTDLLTLGSLGTITWDFNWDGRHIEKSCHLFLFESTAQATSPQSAEGITRCEWVTGDEALARIPFANVRTILSRALEAGTD